MSQVNSGDMRDFATDIDVNFSWGNFTTANLISGQDYYMCNDIDSNRSYRHLTDSDYKCHKMQ